MPSLPYWLYPGDARPPSEIDDEVAEELRLHLDLLAEERMRQGVTPDDARQQAAERFGDFDTLLRRCRAEKQGNLPMLKRIQAVLTLLLLLVVVWLGVRDYTTAATTAQYMTQTTTFLQTIQSDLAEMRGELASRDAPIVASPRSDEDPRPSWGERPAAPIKQLSIEVQDGKGNRLPSAAVTTWQSSSTAQGNIVFRELSFSTPLDDQGCFTTPLPVAGFAAVAPGCAPMSIDVEARGKDERHIVSLPPSSPMELRVVRDDGTTASRVSVVLARRTNLYDVSFDFPTRPSVFRRVTDGDGRVTLDWLEAGDLATLLIKERGKPIESATTVEFEAPSDPSKVVTIKLKEANGRVGGGFGGGEYSGYGGEYGGVVGEGKSYEVDLIDEQERRTTEGSDED